MLAQRGMAVFPLPGKPPADRPCGETLGAPSLRLTLPRVRGRCWGALSTPGAAGQSEGRGRENCCLQLGSLGMDSGLSLPARPSFTLAAAWPSPGRESGATEGGRPQFSDRCCSPRLRVGSAFQDGEGAGWPAQQDPAGESARCAASLLPWDELSDPAGKSRAALRTRSSPPGCRKNKMSPGKSHAV